MGVGGVGGPGAPQPMAGPVKPPPGYSQIGNSGVWVYKYARENGNLEGWAAGKKSAEQIQKMLNRDNKGKEFEVVPGSVISTSSGSAFELRIANPFSKK